MTKTHLIAHAGEPSESGKDSPIAGTDPRVSRAFCFPADAVARGEKTMKKNQDARKLQINSVFAFCVLVALIGSEPTRAADDTFLQPDKTLVGQFFAQDGSESEHAEHWKRYLSRPHPTVDTLRRYFREAAQEFDVPTELLEVIGQVENNWTQIGPSIDQGWGIMHLVRNSYCDTLGEAADALGLDPQLLKDDVRQNIRGAAALIAQYAGAGKAHYTRLEDWFDAVKQFTGLIDDELREMQAECIYQVIRDGVSANTLWGEKVVIEPHKDVDVSPKLIHKKQREEKKKVLGKAEQEIQVLSTDYGPAIWNPADLSNYGTGRNHTIDTWVNHWIGVGTYAGTISWFKDPTANVSAHFVIRSSDGEITQMVRTADTAWHAGATGYPYNNTRSIGVEHDATVVDPDKWNSVPMLTASANMARYFCDLKGIPKTRSLPGIRGHNEMPGTSTECPGPLPWDTWMSYLIGGQKSDLTIVEPVVISPASVAPGGTIRVDWTEKNQGTAASTPAHNTKIFLSASAYGTTYQVGYYGPMNTLGVGATQSYYAPNTVVTASIPPGDYYVTVYIDCDSQVSEENENNNIGSSSPNRVTIIPLDTTPPTVSAFSVTPISLTLGNSFTISYTVSDTGGSGLNRVELWRANDNGGSPIDWAEILPERTSLSGNGPVSGSFSDAPSSTGTYWYGIHVLDNAGNMSLEPNPPGPIQVTVTPLSPPTGVSASDGTYTDKVSITWNSVSGASEYRVYRATSSDGAKTAISNWQSGISYNDTSATPGITYYYWVKARNSYGESDYSDYDTGWVGSGPSNHDPDLSSGYVEPPSGDTNTNFYWYVNYYDQDGDAPATKYVYIDGTPHTMTLYSGTTSNGTYRYGPTALSIGIHDYYFYFTDGNGGSNRLPNSGSSSGPNVTSNYNSTGWNAPTSIPEGWLSEWLNPTNAFESDNQYTTSSHEVESQFYNGFTLGLPVGVCIDGIEIKVEGKASVSNISLCTLLYANGNLIGFACCDLDTTEREFIMGSPCELWGRDWSPEDLANGSFLIRLENWTGNDDATIYVDQLQVRVHYHFPAGPGWKSPTACKVGHYGGPTTEWNNPTNAYTSDNIYATADNGYQYEGYYNFNFDIPAGVVIKGIEVRCEEK